MQLLRIERQNRVLEIIKIRIGDVKFNGGTHIWMQINADRGKYSKTRSDR